MDIERVDNIWWVEKDRWGRHILWSGDSTGFYRQLVTPAQDGPGKVRLEPDEPRKKVHSFVWQLALKRAMKTTETVIVTDQPKGQRPWD